MTSLATPRAAGPAGTNLDRAATFSDTVRSEWTKLRTVRSWRLAVLASVALIVLVALLTASGSSGSGGEAPTGPNGEVVDDSFHFRYRTLDGDGTITARVGVPTGESTTDWAKAGLIVKDGLDQGSTYAAIMRTPGHGVRFQWDFVHDDAGSADASRDLWLRLTREGSLVTGAESTDGVVWRDVGTADIADASRSLVVGMFVASPMSLEVDRSLGGTAVGGRPASSTATFTDVETAGGVSGLWQSQDVGTEGALFGEPGATTTAGDSVTLTGTGDIAPAELGSDPVRNLLAGVVVGILPFLTVAVLFVTSEFRTGVVRLTLAASGRRARVLGAKALVVGMVGFVVGLVGSVLAVAVAYPVLRGNGVPGPDVSLTDATVLRAYVGTAVVVGLLGAMAVGLATVLRRSAPAIAILVLLLVVPQVVSSALPLAAARALLRFTPGSGFVIQSSTVRYDHVDTLCLPEDGCLFDAPVVGVGVVALYCAAALTAGALVLRRRDV